MPFTTYRPSSATVGAKPPALGLTETAVTGGPIVSFAIDWACVRGAFSRPTAIGTAKAPAAVQTSSTFFQAFRFVPASFFMIASILRLRLDPVTQAMQTSGDSR